MASLSQFGTSDGSIIGTTSPFWATARDGAGGSSVDTSIVKTRILKDSGNSTITRGFIKFDTSSLPERISVSAASIFIYLSAHSFGGDMGYPYITITGSTYGSIQTADFDLFNDTEYIASGNRLNYADMSNGQYYEFPLNASGIAAINTSGYTKIAVRDGQDFNDAEPDGSADNSATFYSSEQTGTDNDPYISITYEELPDLASSNQAIFNKYYY